MTVLRAAAYCRVSTAKDDQAYSFESQKHYFMEYISRNPAMELAEIYADEGISGTSTHKRIAFNRMIADASLGKFDVVLTKEVSRFARNTVDTLHFTRQLKRLGIGVRFMCDGIDTLDPDAELRLSIMGSIAQEESRKTSARVKWGQTRRMEQGVVFGRSLLGYDVKNGELIMEPEGAEIVRLIFHKYVNERKGVGVIARELQAAACRTCRGGSEWSGTSVLRILKNEKYCGDLLQKKTCTPDYLTHRKKYNKGEEEKIYIKNHHEPVVSRKLWQEAQREMARRSRKGGKGKCCGNHHLMSGKIKCGCCGRNFSASIKKKSSGLPYRIWRCRSSSECGIGFQVRDEACREAVKRSIGMITASGAEIPTFVTHIASIVTRVYEREKYSITGLMRTELAKFEGKKKRALDAFLSGDISADDMAMMVCEYDEKISELTEKVSAAEKRWELHVTEEELCIRISDILNCSNVSDAFYNCLLDRITAHPGKKLEVKLKNLSACWWYEIH